MSQKFKAKINFVVETEQGDGWYEQHIQYHDLPYEAVLVIEEKLLQFQNDMLQFGKSVAAHK
jgi:hypothetical protein